MILKESLKKVVKEQRMNIESADQGIIREVLSGIDVDIPFAHIISGIRRSGKSTLLRQLLSKLPNFYYLNFEDTRLQSFETSDFEKLVEIFAEEYGESKFYLFDEIQNIQNWEIFIRSGLDRDRRFLITGSNASMLSSELGTRLTGRHLNTELFPFSYKEVLSIKNETPGPESFKNYLTDGGFPEYVKYGKSEILRELLNDIIQRDIVARYKISSSKILFEMAIYLLTNSGKEFTYNALKKTFGLGSVNTAISFVSYLEGSYLLFSIRRFDSSLKKQLVNPKKIYSIDNGLSQANSISLSSDLGRLLENTVFIQLRRKHKDIFYFRMTGECDFVVKEKNRIIMAVQVTYSLSEDNKDRELKGLMEAVEFFKLSEGLLLTFDQEDYFRVGNKTIQVKPVWKWVIEASTT